MQHVLQLTGPLPHVSIQLVAERAVFDAPKHKDEQYICTRKDTKI